MIDRRIVLALPLALLAACKGGSTPSASGGSGPGLEAEADMTMGNPNAKVKMIEYHSVACPACQNFATTVWPEFKAKYIDTGKVFYISREAMTHDKSFAAVGFITAHCAGKDKYFGVVDTIYQRYFEIFDQSSQQLKPEARTVLLDIARSAGLTEAQFNACLNDTQAIDLMQKRWEKYSAGDAKNGTPTILINGKPVANYAMATLSAAVDAALK